MVLPPIQLLLASLRGAAFGGKSSAALWQPAPHCRVFAGEHSASGSLPFDWGHGDADAESGAPVMSAARPVAGAPGVRSVPTALLLYALRRGHKMFFHYQV